MDAHQSTRDARDARDAHTVWLCEKPNQAKDIATVLGIVARSAGAITTHHGSVTWGFGHLLEQLAPDDYDAALASWSLVTLPIIPSAWRVRPSRSGAAQIAHIKGLLATATRVVIATDADREGENIGREILEYCGYTGFIQRLWLSALDPTSIERAVGSLKEDAATKPLHWAAQARARADWMVGMNLSRGITLLHRRVNSNDKVCSVGRVQTPTLALVVRRDHEIATFVPRDFFEIEASVQTADGVAITLRHAPSSAPEDHRIYDRQVAEIMAQRVIGAEGRLRVETHRRRSEPPPLFSLSGLIKACNKRWGFGADKTLDLAQALYETHKALSYPRTDCCYLPSEQVSAVPLLLAQLAQLNEIGVYALAAMQAPVIRRSVFDTKRITAHHAIVPTMAVPMLSTLTPDERRVYLLVCQHYVGALLPDHEFDETRVRMDANGVPITAVGIVPMVAGWKDVFSDERSDDEDDAAKSDHRKPRLPVVADGVAAVARTARIDGRRTSPPKPYTEGTLIEDMCSIAKFASDPAIKARLKETSGIGTEATRPGILKTLKMRGFLALRGKSIVSSPSGQSVIDMVPSVIADAVMTAMWEDELAAIASGELPESARDEFVARVTKMVDELIATIKTTADGYAEPPPKSPKDRNVRRSTSSGGGAARQGASSVGGRTNHGDGAPTEKMVGCAERIARSRGLKAIPSKARSSFAACRQFIEEHGGGIRSQQEAGRPSDAQVALARTLANRLCLGLPAEVSVSRDACRQFIDSHSSSRRRS